MKKVFVLLALMVACNASRSWAQFNPILNPLFDGMSFYNPGYFDEGERWQAMQSFRHFSPDIERWQAVRGVHAEVFQDYSYVDQLLTLAEIALDSTGTKLGVSHSYSGSAVYHWNVYSIHVARSFNLFKSWKAGFGTRLNLTHEVLDLTKYHSLDPNDPLLVRSAATEMDMDAGGWLTNGKAYVGYSLKNMFRASPSQLWYGSMEGQDRFQPEAFIVLGYKFTYKDWSLETTFHHQQMVSNKYISDLTLGSLSAQVGYQNRFFLGVTKQYLAAAVVQNYVARAHIKQRVHLFATIARRGDYLLHRTPGYSGPNYLGFGLNYTMPTS